LGSNLSALTSNSTITGSVNPVFNGVANADGVAVFSVPLTTLNTLSGTVTLGGCLALPTACAAVVNATGTGAFVQNFSFPAAIAGEGVAECSARDSACRLLCLATVACVRMTFTRNILLLIM
jgi:hypothetical protein